jgi:iron complex outermembrane receptor protein
LLDTGGILVTKKVSKKVSLLTCGALALLCMSGSRAALAEDPPSPDQQADQGSQLEEIQVTAEKQATARSVQKVPIAITGIDANTMDETHIQDITDVGRMAPNVILDPSGTEAGTAAFTIRGVGSRSSVGAIDSAVAVTQDGMPLTLQTGLALLGTFDTQSVEILRGPQGVLQGVGAAGGAVTFTTPLPTRDFNASASVTTGNFNLIGTTAVVQGPLASNVFGKIAIFEQHYDGYYENTTDEGTYVPAPGNPSGVVPQHSTGLVGGGQTLIIKPTFLIEFSDTARLQLFAQFESDLDGAPPAEAVNPNPGTGPISKFVSEYGYTPTFSPYVTNVSTPGFVHNIEEHLIGRFDLTLGQGVWTTIAAVRNVNFESVFNEDGSPFNIVIANTKEENRQASLESRYSGNINDSLSFLAGTYLFADNLPVSSVGSTNLTELGKPLAVPGNPNSPLNMDNQVSQYNQRTKSAAVFGNVDYKIVEDLTLSAGVRYQYERKDIDIQTGETATGTPLYCTTGTLLNCPYNPFYDASKGWNTITPRVVVSYQATPNVMTYASYSKGWGAGNFDPGAATPQAAINAANPQTVNSYEIGLKSEWFERRFRANIALYDEAFDNIQKTSTVPVGDREISYLLNAASATIRGAEIELTALPLDGFKVFVTGGFTDAAYGKFTAAVPTSAYNVSEPPTEYGFQNVPRWTEDSGFSYKVPVARAGGDFEIASDWAWRSRQFGDFNNTPQDIIPAYGLLNASLRYSEGPWTVTLWGRNLQNKFYDEVASIFAGWVIEPGQPRTYGLTAAVKF